MEEMTHDHINIFELFRSSCNEGMPKNEVSAKDRFETGQGMHYCILNSFGVLIH